jgi:hypothetical protein
MSAGEALTPRDVAVIRLAVSTALLHGAMGTLATLPAPQLEAGVQKILDVADKLVELSGLEHTP